MDLPGIAPEGLNGVNEIVVYELTPPLTPQQLQEIESAYTQHREALFGFDSGKYDQHG